MNRLLKLYATTTALAAALLLAGTANAFQAPAPATDTKAKTKSARTPTTPAASDKEIADAKAKGLVWVNTGTKVYHKDGQFYGKTKEGKFMTEADAQKAGFRAAKEPGASKKKTDTAPKK